MSLASKPQVLKNCPVLDSKTAVFFELLKVCGAPEKFFGKRFSGDRLKIFSEDLCFLESTCTCVLGPWPREGLPSGKMSLALDFFCVLGLEPCVLDSTSGR